jgi:hypothetical protein
MGVYGAALETQVNFEELLSPFQRFLLEGRAIKATAP